MSSKLLLAVACAGVLAAPAAAVSREGSFTLCHRTGQPSPSGVFRGVIITVARSAVETHLVQHNDILVGEVAKRRFKKGGVCISDSEGALYDSKGKLVQPGRGSDGGDEGGGGEDDAPG